MAGERYTHYSAPTSMPRTFEAGNRLQHLIDTTPAPSPAVVAAAEAFVFIRQEEIEENVRRAQMEADAVMSK